MRVVKAELPALKVPAPVLKELGQQVERGILWNIVNQRQADGSVIRPNARNYADMKRKFNWTDRGQVKPLVAQMRRFIRPFGQSWMTTTNTKNSSATVQPANFELQQLVRWVQQKGFLGWFAVSKKVQLALRGVLRKWIKAEFDKKAKK